MGTQNLKVAIAMDEEQKQRKLPHDVLGYIFKKLNVREATICSLVSRDWRCAWLSDITDLDFDASWKFPQYYSDTDELVRRRDANWYVSWVNRVLESIRVEYINSFKVNFHLKKRKANDIDKWLAFAFEKRVKHLEFNLSFCMLNYSDTYTFPNICDPIECLRIFPSHVNVYSSLSNLQSLSLVFISVSPEVLEFFLSNCPLLEQLCIGNCFDISHFKMNGSKLPLKHLKVYEFGPCGGSLEIYAPNLSSFDCDYSIFHDRILSNIHQKLTKVRIPMDSMSVFRNFFECTPQLEELVIMMDFSLPVSSLLNYFEGVEVVGLKKVELMVDLYESFDGYGGDKHIVLVICHVISNLLDGAPHLDSLKVEFGPNFPRHTGMMQNNEEEEEEEKSDDDDDDSSICHEHAFLKSAEIRCSIIKDENIRIMLKKKLVQTLPSCTQLLFLE